MNVANAFLFPGVNSRAELVLSPQVHARNGAPRHWLGDEFYLNMHKNPGTQNALMHLNYNWQTCAYAMWLRKQFVHGHSCSYFKKVCSNPSPFLTDEV
jgi:hypothetical protein